MLVCNYFAAMIWSCRSERYGGYKDRLVRGKRADFMGGGVLAAEQKPPRSSSATPSSCAKEPLDANENVSKHNIRCEKPVQLLVYQIYFSPLSHHLINLS